MNKFAEPPYCVTQHPFTSAGTQRETELMTQHVTLPTTRRDQTWDAAADAVGDASRDAADDASQDALFVRSEEQTRS